MGCVVAIQNTEARTVAMNKESEEQSKGIMIPSVYVSVRFDRPHPSGSSLRLVNIQTFLVIAVMLLPLTQATYPGVHLHFFYGDGCPHCGHEMSFLDYLEATYPTLVIHRYETWGNKTNAELYVKAAEAYDERATGVPATFIGDEFIIGYGSDATTGKLIEDSVKKCVEGRCVDPFVKAGIIEPGPSDMQMDLSDVDICVVVFLDMTCEPCVRIMPFLEEMEKRYNIDIDTVEVNHTGNAHMYGVYRQHHGVKDTGYPIAFIADKYLMGESSIRDNLPGLLERCRSESCVCPAGRVIPYTPQVPGPEDTVQGDVIINIPLFGTVDTRQAFLPGLTLAIALVDGFNPCTMWVLSFLLSLLVYAKSRRRILLVGFTFIAAVFVIYFLFMVAWLNVFLYLTYVEPIRIFIGLVAVIAGLINMKELFWWKKGVSLTIPDRFKPRLFKQARSLVKEGETAAVITGTLFLAAFSSLIELPCTAGFPAIYTKVLTLRGHTGINYYAYIAAYNAFYILPLSLIILGFAYFMEHRKYTEEQGKYLKFGGGLIMLLLGLALIFKPELLMFG